MLPGSRSGTVRAWCQRNLGKKQFLVWRPFPGTRHRVLEIAVVERILPTAAMGISAASPALARPGKRKPALRITLRRAIGRMGDRTRRSRRSENRTSPFRRLRCQGQGVLKHYPRQLSTCISATPGGQTYRNSLCRNLRRRVPGLLRIRSLPEYSTLGTLRLRQTIPILLQLLFIFHPMTWITRT